MTNQTNKMNVTEAEKRSGEIYAALYWHDRGTFPLDGGDEEYKTLKAEFEKITTGLAEGRYPPEINQAGCYIHRDFLQHGSRYVFDSRLNRNGRSGWKQYDTDQDAWYFGAWVNLKTLQVLTYCEGDVTLSTAPGVGAMARELISMNAFYKPGIVMIVCDGIGMENGKIKPEGVTDVVVGDTITAKDVRKLYQYEPQDRPLAEPITMAEVLRMAEGKETYESDDA